MQTNVKHNRNSTATYKCFIVIEICASIGDRNSKKNIIESSCLRVKKEETADPNFTFKKEFYLSLNAIRF